MTDSHVLARRLADLISAVDQAQDLIAIYEFEGDEWHFSFVNQAFAKTTGYSRSELVGRTSGRIVADSMDPVRLGRIRAALRDGQSVRGEILFKGRDGGVLTFDFSARPIEDEAPGRNRRTVVIFRDVTQRKEHAQALQFQADHDSLTGLKNRRYFESTLDSCCAGSRPDNQTHAVLFIDLDGFKGVNDRLGHEAGDAVLKSVSVVFQASALGSDVLARWGGDEFAMLLYHCTTDHARTVAQRVLEAVANAVNLPKELGASIGIAAVRATAAETMRVADSACYAAKAAGKNSITLAP